jgi:hypothetical protein
MKKPQISYLSFHSAFCGFRLYDKQTDAYVSKFIPYWSGLTVEETKEKYNLKPFVKTWR